MHDEAAPRDESPSPALPGVGDLGAFGERVAAAFLTHKGCVVLKRNLRVGGTGEVDLLVRDGRSNVVVEVKAVTGRSEPLDRIDAEKLRNLRRSIARMGLRVDRIDGLGIAVGPEGAAVRWVTGIG